MKTRIATIVVVMGLGGGFWVTTEAIAPQISQAETARVELSLERQPNETYDALVRRAEAAVTAAAQARFDQDIQVTDVSAIIVAQNQGAIAPVLSLQVSRTQWLSSPDPQSWAKYFANARSLLGFENVATKTPAQTDTGGGGVRYPTRSYPNQTGTSNAPASSRERLNSYPNQTGTSNPYSPYSRPYTPRTPPNRYFGQPGTATPYTSGQPNSSYSGQPGTVNPSTPSQTQTPGTGISPQSPTTAPGNTPSSLQTPSSSTPSVPSSLTPANVAPNTLGTPTNSGTVNPASNNIPRTQTLPNSSVPGVPSTSSPANVAPNTVGTPTNSGTTVNPAPTSSGNTFR